MISIRVPVLRGEKGFSHQRAMLLALDQDMPAQGAVAKRSAAMLLALDQDMPALRLGMAPNWIVVLSLNPDATKD